MTKPMYCPMTFCNPELTNTRINGKEVVGISPVFCTPDCAWALEGHGVYGCAIGYIAVKNTANYWGMNTRPLKDDVE